MTEYIGKKVLITTSNWFIAKDGNQYRACWGTLKGIYEAGKLFGFIPNRAHANWFIEIGNLTIMGCQVLYVLLCDERPNTDKINDYTVDAAHGLREYHRPTQILILE